MQRFVYAGLLLIFLGLFLLLAGIVLNASNKNIRVEGAGIIMIGPIPIMFGSKRLLLPLAITAIALMLTFYLLFWRR